MKRSTDPPIWYIHGEYETFGKYIVTKSNVTAQLVQIHPFTLGWIAELHLRLAVTDPAKKLIERLAFCNPTVTVLDGDIAAGSGVYGYYKKVRDTFQRLKVSDLGNVRCYVKNEFIIKWSWYIKG